MDSYHIKRHNSVSRRTNSYSIDNSFLCKLCAEITCFVSGFREAQIPVEGLRQAPV